MENIQIFKSEEFGEIRTVEKDAIPYFNLSDICKALDISNTSKLKERLKEDGITTSKVTDSMGRNQEMLFINESNLYRTIFQSRKPNAEKFTDWVTSEVLPSIRKHGAYMEDDVIEKALTSPDFLIQLATQLKEEKAKTSKLTVQNEIMRPKAEYFDELVDRNLLTNIRDTAKELGVKQNAFVSFLLGKKYLYRDKQGTLKPFADKLSQGLFEVKEHINNKTKWSGIQTLITPKGRETFRLLLIEK